MLLRQIYDAPLAQYAYLIGCQRSGEAIVIDPERDIDRYLDLARENDLKIVAVAETHIHADFLSGARQLLETQPGTTAYLSDEGDDDWKYQWANGRDDVRLLKHGDEIHIGKIVITAIHTPGHTPEHLSFLVEDRGGGADAPMGLVSGDFVFVGDVGRPDLLETAAGQAGAREPAARALYQSVLDFEKLPDFVQVLPAHGAGSACGKALGAIPTSTVGYEKRFNGAIVTARQEGEDAFVDSILEGQPEPPLYFARMKRDNKEGPALIDGLPDPKRIEADALPELLGDPSKVFLDTRADRESFMRAHLGGSLFAPLGGSAFTTVAGSYVTEDQEIFLVLEDESDLEQAVRQLIRIGLDTVVGFTTVAELDDLDQLTVSTTRATTADLEAQLENHANAVVLDVRSASEFASGHVEGARNIAHTRLLDQADNLDRDRTCLVHCGSGMRAASATSLLERLGFDVVYLNGPVGALLQPAAAEA